MERITLKVPAKVNLYLRVGRKRKDGYHELTSLVQTVSLFDTLTLSPREKGIEIIPSLPLPRGRENTCFRIAELFFQKTEIEGGVKIRIEKKIPPGSGLGGGASDAAGILLALREIFPQGNLSEKEIFEIAKKVGSDVPFFLRGGTCILRGRGEKIYSLPPLKEGYFVLLYPGFPIFTSWAYQALGEDLTKKRLNVKLVTTLCESGSLRGIEKILYNSFEKVILKEFPLLKKIKEEIEKEGFPCLLTGTGSCIFTFTEGEKESTGLREKMGKWGEVWVARPLPEGISIGKEVKGENLRGEG